MIEAWFLIIRSMSFERSAYLFSLGISIGILAIVSASGARAADKLIKLLSQGKIEGLGVWKSYSFKVYLKSEVLYAYWLFYYSICKHVAPSSRSDNRTATSVGPRWPSIFVWDFPTLNLFVYESQVFVTWFLLIRKREDPGNETCVWRPLLVSCFCQLANNFNLFSRRD